MVGMQFWPGKNYGPMPNYFQAMPIKCKKERSVTYKSIINGHQVEYECNWEKERLVTYWEDEETGRREFIKYIYTLFNYPRISELQFRREWDKTCLEWIAQHAKGKVDQFYVAPLPSWTRDDFNYAENLCGMAKSIFLCRESTHPIDEQDELITGFDFRFNFEQITLGDVKRLTLNRLIELSSVTKSLVFYNSLISYQDVNQFFKLWISNEHEMRLSSLIISPCYNYTIDRLMDGIEYEAVKKQNHAKFTKPYHAVFNNKEYKFKRSNGSEAFMLFTIYPPVVTSYVSSFEVHF
ncbi:unnamed protein product [Caenorhabditis brenneri]